MRHRGSMRRAKIFTSIIHCNENFFGTPSSALKNRVLKRLSYAEWPMIWRTLTPVGNNSNQLDKVTVIFSLGLRLIVARVECCLPYLVSFFFKQSIKICERACGSVLLINARVPPCFLSACWSLVRIVAQSWTRIKRCTPVEWLHNTQLFWDEDIK